MLSNLACSGLRSLSGTDLSEVKMEQEDTTNSAPITPSEHSSDSDSDQQVIPEIQAKNEMMFRDALEIIEADINYHQVS